MKKCYAIELYLKRSDTKSNTLRYLSSVEFDKLIKQFKSDVVYDGGYLFVYDDKMNNIIEFERGLR